LLWVEAERHGVQASVLCPGAVPTGGQYGRLAANVNEVEVMKKIWEPLRPMAPEMFAERALRVVLRGDAIIVVPAWWTAW
jgi:short-subunit dehydrogenase